MHGKNFVMVFNILPFSRCHKVKTNFKIYLSQSKTAGQLTTAYEF